MSATASTPTAISAVEEAAFVSLPGLIGMAFAGKLAPVSVTLDKDIIAAQTASADAIAHLQTTLENAESSNPLLVQSIACFRQIAQVLGLQLPSEDAIFTGVKEAAHDVLSSLQPSAAAPPAPAT